MVKILPCADKFEKKTFLGVFIGDLSTYPSAQWNKETGVLQLFSCGHNPMIFIPEINEVVLGCASWWGKIKSEEELKDITDEDINNVWYVKALKQLQKLDEAK
jgi:hypothetical protein